jgi:hypothetical protein
MMSDSLFSPLSLQNTCVDLQPGDVRSPLNIRPLFYSQNQESKGNRLICLDFHGSVPSQTGLVWIRRNNLDWLRLNVPGILRYVLGLPVSLADVGFVPGASAQPDCDLLCRYRFPGWLRVAGMKLSADRQEFFILKDQILYEDDAMKCLSYVPDQRINWVVMDVSALCAPTGGLKILTIHFCCRKKEIAALRCG